MNKYTKFAAAALAIAFPAMAMAATTHTFSTVIYTIITYLNKVLVLMMAFAIVMFTWYVIKYYVRPNEDRKEGNTYVMYSIIGFFVILSFWGLVNILQNSFGLQNNANKPGDWASFTTIFPGSGSSASTNTNTNIFNNNDPAGELSQ